MHAANLTDVASELGPDEPADLLDDPQAVMATAQQVTASTITRRWRAQCRVSLGVSRTSYSRVLARHPSLLGVG